MQEGINWITIIFVNILLPALLIAVVVRLFTESKIGGIMSTFVGFMIIAMCSAWYFTGDPLNGFFHPITMGWKPMYQPILDMIVTNSNINQ